jgi:hypothetical protein
MKLIHDEETVRQAVARLAAAPEGSELEFAFIGPRYWATTQADAVELAVARVLPGLLYRREAEYGAESEGFYPNGAYSTVRIIVRKGATTGQ